MLTNNELKLRFEAGVVTLAFDTNVIHELKAWRKACRLLGAIRPFFPNRASVSALVCAEMLFDLRCQFGRAFDAGVIVQSLLDLGVDVAPFESDESDHFAARQARLFPTENEWRAAKARASRNCLGIGAVRSVPGTGKTCAANVDWFIAAHALADGAILVGHDEGPEFVGLDRIALTTLTAVCSELAAGGAPA